MAHKKNTTNLTELLLQYVTQPDPMLSMLEWLCIELMEAEVDQQLGAEKSQRTDGRSGYRSGYRPRRLDTRMGTMYLAGCVKISSSNMIERLNREIRRRTSVIGIFPNKSSYVRLVTTYLMEYAEDWSASRVNIQRSCFSSYYCSSTAQLCEKLHGVFLHL